MRGGLTLVFLTTAAWFLVRSASSGNVCIVCRRSEIAVIQGDTTTPVTGSHFSDEAMFRSEGPITGLRSWTRRTGLFYLQCLQFRYRSTWGPLLGAASCSAEAPDVSLELDAPITGLLAKAGSIVDSLTFFTQDGALPLMGGSGGDPFISGNFTRLLYLEGFSCPYSGEEFFCDLTLHVCEKID